ncbi:hypothetical protein VW35_17815 [Devosia soli]|uniref:DUF427 domain-containing protein n=1 Tax=Devosia soli TaxID=361041 RepID=A0A0F5L351_9HYPH|nr:DUF427 domain-containing protein [Devosia soli]KKB76624.1 hypothetical protein VW35_17815 [Devosia soli]
MTADETATATVTPVSGRVHIFFDDAEIASSANAMQVNEASGRTQYFVPLDHVHPGILEASDTRRDEPGKGEAHFYTIKTLTADGPDEAWYFPYAEGEYADIRDLITFGGARVKVTVSDV